MADGRIIVTVSQGAKAKVSETQDGGVIESATGQVTETVNHVTDSVSQDGQTVLTTLGPWADHRVRGRGGRTARADRGQRPVG